MQDVEEAQPGDIIVMAGIEDVTIGDTICTKEAPEALPRIHVDEPTVAMRFGINTSPLAGGKAKPFRPAKFGSDLTAKLSATFPSAWRYRGSGRLSGQGAWGISNGHSGGNHAA